MTVPSRDDLSGHMAHVAKALLGAPNQSLSKQGKEWRYGTHGSLAIDLHKGTYFDFETNEGGGVLDLIKREKGLTGGAAIDFMRQIGCDLSPLSGNGIAAVSNRRLVATFDYTYATGKLASQVLRYEPKQFIQRRPDGNGGWRFRGGPPLPYRLREIIEAIGLGHTIFVVEGEGKVDALADWNVPATCCAGGAKKWKPEHSEYLRGADVVILPDNDDPGRDHANVVGASLQGIASQVRVLELPGLGPKGDIVNWIEAGGTPESFWKLVESKARLWVPSDQPSSSDGKLVVRCAADIQPEPVEFLWPGRIAIGKQSLIAGEVGLGKSQITMSMAAAVTTGGPWPCGEGLAPLGSVIFLSAEDGASDTIVPRLMAAGADLTKVHIVTAVRDDDGKGQRAFNLQSDLGELEAEIKRRRDVRLVNIDPISSYLGPKVDSHVNAAVRGVLEPVGEMASRLRVAVVSVTHPPKGTGTTAINRFIGSIAFVAAARAAFMVTRDADDAERRLLLPVKNNLAPLGKGLAFRLEQCIVGDRDKGIVASAVAWESSPVDISADAALQAADAQVSGGTSAVAEAEEFLRDILAAGPIPQKEVKDAAGGHGLAWRTVQRAKARLRVRATKDGMDGGWSWSLPKDANDDEERHPLRMATFGQVGALQDDDLEIPGFLRRSVA